MTRLNDVAANSRSACRAKAGAALAVGVALTAASGCVPLNTVDSAESANTAAPVNTAVGSSAAGDPRLQALSASGQQLVGAVVSQTQPQHIEIGMSMELNINGTMMGTDGVVPLVVTDVDDDGDVHTTLDLGAGFGSMASIAGGDAGQKPELRAEQWSDGEWMYLDFTGFDSARSRRGGDAAFADLLRPGLFKVDIDRYEAATDSVGVTSDAVADLTGQGMDFSAFLYALAANADESAPDPDDPSKQRIETTLNALIEQSADGTIPMFERFGEIGDMFGMADAIGAIPVIFVFSSDEQGRVDDLIIDIDMSSFVSGVAGLAPGADEPADSGAAMKISIPVTIGYQSVGDITVPADITDDRTDQFIAVTNSARTGTGDTDPPPTPAADV